MNVDEPKLASAELYVENSENLLDCILEGDTPYFAEDYEYKSDADAIYSSIQSVASSVESIGDAIGNLIYDLEQTGGIVFNADVYEAAKLEAYSLIQDNMTIQDAYCYNYLQYEYCRKLCNQYEDMVSKGYTFSEDIQEQYRAAKEFCETGYDQQSTAIAEARTANKERVSNLNKFYGSLEDYDTEVASQKAEAARKKAEYDALPWYGKAWNNIATGYLSFQEGLISVGETIVDGAIMLGSGLTLYCSPVGVAMNTLSLVQEVCGVSSEDTIVGQYKKGVQNVVQYDFAGSWYDEQVKLYGLNEYAAYGGVHTAFKTTGSIAGYVGISLIPGGAIVTGTLGGLAAAGSAAKQAFDSGASYDQSLFVSSVAGVAGFASGGALNKVQGLAAGTTSIGGILGYTALGAGVSMLEPAANTTAQYFTYGKDMVDENGNKMYDSFWDYAVKSGGLEQMAFAAAVGGFSTGIVSVNAYDEVYGYASNENITRDKVKIAQKNYNEHSDYFTSRRDYYDSLDYVERNSKYAKYDSTTDMWVGSDVRIGRDDPGLTSCLSEKGKKVWADSVKKNTSNGKVRVNVGTSNAEGFDRFVLEQGALGRSGDYNFGRLGDASSDTFIARSKENSIGVVNQFENDTGIPNTKSNRVVQYSYEVDENSISMHTGKELGSNSQRLSGGLLPDGTSEVVIDSTSVSAVGGAGKINVSVIDDAGNKWFGGTLEDLANLKKTDPGAYSSIMGQWY